MRTIVLAGLSVIAGVTSALAADVGPFAIDVRGGFTTASMSQLNADAQKSVDDFKDNAFINGDTVDDASYTKLSGGAYVRGGLSYAVSPLLSLGARGGYMSAGQGKLVMNSHSSVPDGFGGTINTVTRQTSKFTATAIPIMVGGSVRRPVSDRFAWTGALYVGEGMATFNTDDNGTGSVTDTLFSFSSSYTAAGKSTYTGSALALEVTVGFDYQLASSLSLGGDLGYHMLKVAKVKATDDVDYDGDGVADVRKGDVYVDDKNNAIPIDFSGISAVAQLTLHI